MEFKNLSSRAIAKEYIKEAEYLREVSSNDISKETYEMKKQYENELLKELFNRGIIGWANIKDVANK